MGFFVDEKLFPGLEFQWAHVAAKEDLMLSSVNVSMISKVMVQVVFELLFTDGTLELIALKWQRVVASGSRKEKIYRVINFS